MQLINARRTNATPAGLLPWGFGLALLAGFVYWSPLIAGLLMLLVSGGLAVAWLAWRHPELGLLTIGFLVSELIPSDQIVISLRGLRAHPEDLTLLGVVSLFVVWGLRRRRMVISHWAFVGPLVAFAGFACFSALYAVGYEHVSPILAVGELRPAVYCVGCVITAMMIVRRDQLLILLAGLFLIADWTGGAIIVHQFTGVPPSLGNVPPSGVWQINTMTDFGGGFGSVRVVPPAHVLLYLMANIALCLALRPPKIPGARSLLILQCAFLGLALLLTYTRAQWVATAIALLLASFFLPRATIRSLGRHLRVAIPVVAVAIWLLGGGVIGGGMGGTAQALASRATSIITPNSTLNSASLQWRAFEDQSALSAITDHPLLGVGVGNDYREITLLQGEASGWLWALGGPSRLTRWVHNSYLYMAVKMGLPALGAFIWFSIAFLVGGTRAYLRMPDVPEKLVVLAILTSFVGLLEWVVFEAHLMLAPGMTTLGLMVGIVAIAGSIARSDKHDEKGEDLPPKGSAE